LTVSLLPKNHMLFIVSMILETPKFKVTNIIFESYEHRSKIILHHLYFLIFKYFHFKCIDILTINCSDMFKSTVNSPMYETSYGIPVHWTMSFS
jgi:hypothetical protein